MREAWKGETCSFHGEYFHIEGAAVAPRPAPEAASPVRIAALNPQSFVRAAELGLHIFVGLRGTDISALRGRHRDATRRRGRRWASGGGQRLSANPGYAAATRRGGGGGIARELGSYFRRQSRHGARRDGQRHAHDGRASGQADELADASATSTSRDGRGRRAGSFASTPARSPRGHASTDDRRAERARPVPPMRVRGHRDPAREASASCDRRGRRARRSSDRIPPAMRASLAAPSLRLAR